jgi:hypothetical protein
MYKYVTLHLILHGLTSYQAKASVLIFDLQWLFTYNWLLTYLGFGQP